MQRITHKGYDLCLWDFYISLLRMQVKGTFFNVSVRSMVSNQPHAYLKSTGSHDNHVVPFHTVLPIAAVVLSCEEIAAAQKPNIAD